MSTSSKAALGFIAGAAVGVAVGYFLNSDKKDEYIEVVKDKAGKLKDKVKDRLNKKSDQLESVAIN